MLGYSTMDRKFPLLPLLFGFLVVAKALLILQENRFTEYKSALVYMAIFGSPQILWLLLTIRATEKKQTTTAIAVLSLFTISAWHFGFIPGTKSPNWGGAHFEVPVAFFVEWAIAGIFLVPFWFFRSRRSSNVA